MPVNLSLTHASSSIWRTTLALPAAVLATLVIFTMLSKLTSPGDISLNRALASPELDFLLLRKDSDLEYRSRLRPPPPEETIEVEEFTLQQPALAETLSVDMPRPNLEVPNIKIDMQIDMRPALAPINAAEISTQMFAVDIPFQKNLKAVKDVLPQYPSRALRKKIEGMLKAEFIVGANGYVKQDSIKFIEANPKDVFEKSVIRSLKRSRFETMISNGQPVAYRAQKTYHYQIPK